MFKKSDFRPGILTYDELDKIIDKRGKLVEEFLDEDLLQITYPNSITLDVGWYPALDKNGKFRIMVIKDFKWDKPIKALTCKSIDLLKKHVKRLHRFILKENEK